MKTAQVAELLNVAEPTIRRWVHYGFIPHVKLGRAVRFREKDIDFKRGVVRVDNKKDHHTKNYQVRGVSMNETVAEVLRRIPRRLDSSYVFQRKSGEKFHKMRSGFENVVKRAKIPRVRFHDLRHTFASHLVMGGVDIRTVQEVLGHEDIRTTMRYSHLAPDHTKNAVRILDSHYLDTKGSEQENQSVAGQA